jgi:hypothetical protein
VRVYERCLSEMAKRISHPQKNLKKVMRLPRKGGLALLMTDNFICPIVDVAKLAYRLSRGSHVLPDVESVHSPQPLLFRGGHSFRAGQGERTPRHGV